MSTGFLSGPEIYCAPKDALEPIGQTPVRNFVVRKTEFFKDLSAGLELDDATLLPHSLRCGPDDHQSILTERETVVGMTLDLKRKLAVATAMD